MYSIPYLLLAFVLYFLYLNEQRRLKSLPPKVSIWIAYIIMWLFIGLRGHIMSDFISYVIFYEDQCPTFNVLITCGFKSIFEPGFVIYTSIIKSLGLNYFGWISINTLIDLIVFAWFFKRYCKSMILPLIFFIAFNGLLIEFNLLRNVKAIDLFLISLPYLQRHKIMPYMLLNSIGILFHTSSIIYIPLYFILYRRIPKWLMWGGFVVSNIIFLFNIHIIGNLINQISLIQGIKAYDKIIGYASNNVEFKLSIGYLERTFAFILFSILYKNLIRDSKSNIIFYNCYWLYYCCFLTFYEVVVFAERIPTLFMFSYWILYPNAMYAKYYYRKLVNIIIIFLILIKILATYNYASSKYENLLFGISNYETRKKIVLNDFDK